MAATNLNRSKKRFQHGSIVRLFLRDFMQYTEMEVKPGPTLNVIIGPNGSGKSSVVNGLALALGAKTAVLGRADDVQDFIRIGKNEAEVEVELHNEAGSNFVINRKWSKCESSKTKTIWTLNGRVTTGKQVTDLVRKLNIQTDNLCQFLPQDKVHDFSKMNSKQLLGRTIDAIGDNQLKEDHERLKSMQNDVFASEDHYRMKLTALNDNRKKAEDLEKDVKNLEEKEKIERKIKLLEIRREWNLSEEAKKNMRDAEDRRKAVEKKIKDEEKKLAPIQKEIQQYEKEVQKLQASVRQDQEAFRASMGPAKNKADRIEQVRDEMDNLDNRMNEILAEQEEKKAKIREMNSEIERIKREIDNEDTNEQNPQGGSSAEKMAADMNTVKSDLKSFQNESARLATLVSELKMETKALESKMSGVNASKNTLLNVDKQKMEILRERIPQGKDASQSIQWVENNRNKFRGNVYTPIVLHINVNDANTAKYLENSIQIRDMVAFAAEEADDANLLMEQLRNISKLRINVVTVPSDADMQNYSPDPKQREYFEKSKDLDFKGFLSEMFTAPDPIKAYLCQQYHLHTIPIFGSKAEASTQKLVDSGVRVFFIGDIRNQTMRSRYDSNQKSTISSRITPKNWMNISVDKVELRKLDAEIKKFEKEHAIVHNNMRQNIESQKNVERELESKRKELKDLQQRLHYKKVLKTKLITKIEQKQSLEKEFKVLDTDKERNKIEKEKRNHLMQCVRLNADLKNLLVQGTELKIRSELSKLKIIPMEGEKEYKTRKYEQIDREIDAWRTRLGEEKENVRYKASEFKEALQKAQKLTDPLGNYKEDSISDELYRRFEKENIQSVGTDECRIQIQELEAQLECIDDIDVEVIRRFKMHKKNVADLEQEIERIQSDMEKRRENVDVVRNRWLDKLTKLIEEISEKFSYFFSNMGFAGMVELGKGEHINDFANYGIEILVKFRENVPLQKLDPFKQSGGERSVSTALYMLALQHLTKVPFRCVDEINQGMDAKNERRVFDMLMHTSVKDNTAQYFLLTPKLLPELKYESGVTVLIVHNSETMCSYSEWNLDNIIAAKEACNRSTRVQ